MCYYCFCLKNTFKRDLNKKKNWYIYPFVTLSSVFISFCSSSFPPGIDFLLLRAFFNISYSTGLLVMNSFSFCMSKKDFILPLFLKDIFTEKRILGWPFFCYFKDADPMIQGIQGLHCFQKEICCHLNLHSLSFSPYAFNVFLYQWF